MVNVEETTYNSALFGLVIYIVTPGTKHTPKKQRFFVCFLTIHENVDSKTSQKSSTIVTWKSSMEVATKSSFPPDVKKMEDFSQAEVGSLFSLELWEKKTR